MVPGGVRFVLEGKGTDVHTPFASQVTLAVRDAVRPEPQSSDSVEVLVGEVQTPVLPQVEDVEVVGVMVMAPAEVQAKVLVTPQAPKASAVVEVTAHPCWQQERR